MFRSPGRGGGGMKTGENLLERVNLSGLVRMVLMKLSECIGGLGGELILECWDL